MPAIDLERLLADLKKGKVASAYLLLGDDQYLLDLARENLRREILGAGGQEQPFGLKVFELGGMGMQEAATTLADALAQARTPSLLSPRQLLFLSGFGKVIKRMRSDEAEERELKDERQGGREADSASGKVQALLEEYLAKPSDFTVVVFEATEVDKRKKLTKLLEKRCVVVGVESPVRGGRGRSFDEQIRTAALRAGKLAQDRGIEIEPQALTALVRLKDGDMGMVLQELEKLAMYVGSAGRIGLEEVRLLVRGSTEELVWEVVDALSSGDRRRSITLLDNLIRNGESPPAIVGALAYRIRAMIEAKEGSQRWPALQAAEQARRFSPEQLLSSLEMLLRADVMLKGELPKAEDGQKVLEFLIARLTAMSHETGDAQRDLELG